MKLGHQENTTSFNITSGKTIFYHLRLDITTTTRVLRSFQEWLSSSANVGKTIFFINAHCFNLSLINQAYCDSLNEADLLLNDGIGIKIAAKRKKLKILENMNGTDLIPKLVSTAANQGAPVYILGGEPGIAEQAGKIWESKYSALKISGTHSGFFDNDAEILEKINQSEAKVLIVGMGVPKQEIWIKKNISLLTNIKCAIGGGAILDFTAGKFPRAPKIIRALGLEWAFRLILEPKRLYKRYVIGNLTFLFHVFSN